MENKVEKLQKLQKLVEGCEDCALCRSRNNVVFGKGNPDGGIVLIGEAPGANEDDCGIPFVGRAGKLLDEILASVDLNCDKSVYILNTIKCRPPNNRDPLLEEKLACRKFFDKQLEIIKPKIILLCGAVAMRSMIDNPLGITKVRGQWFDGKDGVKMMAIFHPSYLLRNHRMVEGSPRWLMLKDMKEIRKVYDEMIGSGKS